MFTSRSQTGAVLRFLSLLWLLSGFWRTERFGPCPFPISTYPVLRWYSAGCNVNVVAPVWTFQGQPGRLSSCKAVDFGRFIVAEIMFLSVILSCF